MRKVARRKGSAVALVAAIVVSIIGMSPPTPASAGTAETINALPVLDALNRAESTLSDSGKWSALSWASNSTGHATGRDTESGWSPYDVFSTVNGAYWNPATFTDANGSATAITIQSGPTNERYVSLWLDMANPGSSKSGYQLRWTGLATANTYKITLSRWSSGTQTVLAQQASVQIPAGSTIALSDTGSTVQAWKGSGGSLMSFLTANDSSFSGGYAGLDGAGNLTRSRDFKAGALLNPPDTTLSGAPSGLVLSDLFFSFASTDPSATFECSLDSAAYGACSPPQRYRGLVEGMHNLRVRATNAAGPDPTPIERSFQVVDTERAVSKVALRDDFEREESPLAQSDWSQLPWSTDTGGLSSGGYGSAGATSGAYWNQATLNDGGETQLVAGTLDAGPTEEGEYLSLWLDMPDPESDRSGYEARLSATGSSGQYDIELAKWVSGSRQVLADTAGVSLLSGASVALSETAGGALSVWAGSDLGSSVLTATDSSYASGYFGLEAKGPLARLSRLRAGRIDLEPPDTTIDNGPSGTVTAQGVSFSFSASETEARFKCSLDGEVFSACDPPQAYPSIEEGSHSFRVRAVDPVDNVDLTPAEWAFRVGGPPTAAAEPASEIGGGEATLKANINPNGFRASYQFEYGPTPTYGNVVPVSAKTIGPGNQMVAVHQIAEGLEPTTTYHYRVTAESEGGTVHGEDGTFTTLSSAPVQVAAFGPVAESAPGSLVGAEAPLSVSANQHGGRIHDLELQVDGSSQIKVTREEALEGDGSESCSEGVCTLSFEFPYLFSGEVSPGRHSFAVIAHGAAGEEATYEREVVVDAGIPTLELGGSLIEAEGALHSSFSSATITAQAVDGSGANDSGVAKIEFFVDGVLQKEVPADCKAGCPASLGGEYKYEEQDWGMGPHELTVVALDGAGNESSTTVPVNQELKSLEPPCNAPSVATMPAGEAASTSEAVQAIQATLPAAVESPTPDPTAEEFEPTFAQGESRSEGADAFVAQGGLVGGRVVQGSSRAFTIGQASCLAPTQTTEAETAPEILPSGTIVYANTAPDTDTFVRNNGVGATIVESFRGGSGPSSMTWSASLKNGQELRKLGDGGLAVYSSNGIDLRPAELPSPPAGMNDPKQLRDTATVLGAASYDLRKANNELTGAVEAVMSPPLVITSAGTVERLALTPEAGGRFSTPVPQGATAMVMRTESSPMPEDVCAAAFESDPQGYAGACEPETDQAGERLYITSMDWAPDGSFVYTAVWNESGIDPEKAVHWLPDESFLFRASEDGAEVEEIETPGFTVLGSVKVSPDGSQIAFNGCELASLECGVVLTNASGEGGRLVAATEGFIKEAQVSFSKNSQRLFFEVGNIEPWHGEPEAEVRQLFSCNLDGTDKRQLTDFEDLDLFQRPFEDWAVGGTFANLSPPVVDPASTALILEYPFGIGEVQAARENVKRNELTLLSGEKPGDYPAVNATGTRIAYSRDGEGIIVMNRNGSGKELIVPSPLAVERRGERAIYPDFSPDGSEIAYIRNGVIYRAPASEGSSTLAVEAEYGGPRTLLESLLDSAAPQALIAPIESAERLYLDSSSPGALGSISEGLDVLEAMDEWEIGFCIEHLGECKAFADDRALALSARGALFTNRYQEDRSTMGNAFQHGFWTALMVRDSPEEYEGLPDGLLYAFHHETKPFNFDDKQDLTNDVVGYAWFVSSGIEEVAENVYKNVDRLKVCQGLLPKAKNAIFIHGGNPFRYIQRHPEYEYGRLIFRKLRGDNGNGQRILPTGRTCAEVWAAIS